MDATGNVSIAAADIDNGSSDACGAVSLSLDVTSFDCTNLGDNTVTLTVTDANGNSSTGTAVVTVEDVTDPVTPVLAGLTGDCSVTATAPTTTDVCAGTITGTTADPLTYNTQGTYSIDWTFDDGNGNVITVPQNVIVDDNTAPTVVTQNITVQLDATGNVSIAAADIDNGSSDACGIGSLSLNITDFTCAELGYNTVTLTVTDVNGNSATGTATVTVEDVTDPVTPTLSALTGECSVTATAPTTTDACAGNITGTTTDPLTYTTQGSYSIDWTFDDGNGNVITVPQNVIVDDNTAPTVVTQNITVQLDATGNVSIAAADIDNGSSDACGAVSLSLDVTSFDCTNLGDNTVTLTVTDANGNSSTGTAVVTVEDVTDPVTPVLAGLTGDCSVTATAPTTTDVCAGTITGTTADPLTYNTQGTYSIDWIFDDGNGNAITVPQSVTVDDVTNPVAVCQNIAVSLDGSGNASITGADVDGGSTDNCTVGSLSVSPNTFTNANLGANTVTLTVTDGNGNTNTCTATVTVEDNEAPTAVCQDITIALDASGSATITAADIDGGSSDNTGINSLTASQTAFDCSNVGTNNVTLTVEDLDGNTSNCTAVVTVEDNTVPTILTQDITVQLDDIGNVTIAAADIDNGSSDACGIANMSLDITDFTCTDLGSNTVTLTVTDVNGNSANGTATVTVEDNLAPIISDCPANITVTADDDYCGNTTTWTAPTATDNCGVTLTGTHTSGDFFNVGTTTVTYTAEDASGNITTCTFDVIVEPVAAPVINGDTEVCTPTNVNYTTPLLAGKTYQWNVTNGIIIGADDTDEIDVSWDGNTSGSVEVIVTSGSGCSINNSINVTQNERPITGDIQYSNSLNRR